MTTKQEEDPIFIEAERVKRVIDLSERATGFGPDETKRVHSVIEHRLYRFSELSARLLIDAYVGAQNPEQREQEVESVLTRVILASDYIAGIDQPEESSVDPSYLGHLAGQVAPVIDIRGDRELNWCDRVDVEVTRPALFAEIESNAPPDREDLLIAA